jgi:hypothetical protein
MSAENQATAKYLLKELAESRTVEHKSWIDPQTPEGAAHLVRALIALRNNVDGGAIVIGVDDKTRTLIPTPRELDVKQVFKDDLIQPLVTKYATPAFEVVVEFVEIDTSTYPVILIPRGVTAPVMCKRDSSNGDGERLLKQKTIYVRTARHGRIGTSEADGEDLKELIDTCIANRELDNARFLTRLFHGLQPNEVRTALSGLQELANQANHMIEGTEQLRENSLARFRNAAQNLTRNPQDFGFGDIALLIDGPRLSPISSKPASDYRIKTSHFYG